MLLDWDWLPPAVWIAIIGAAALLLVAGAWRSKWRGTSAEYDVRHEVIDECFAKGEMTLDEYEAGCASLGHGHAPESQTASHADDRSPAAEEDRTCGRGRCTRPSPEPHRIVSAGPRSPS